MTAVLIRFDGARSAYRSPYYLAEVSGGPALPTETGGFRSFARKDEATDYVETHGRTWIDDTGEEGTEVGNG